MINIAEFDCPGCQNSATEMGASATGGGTAGASVDQAGGIIIEVLMTAGFVSPPTKTDLDMWVTKYNLNFTVVADLSSRSRRTTPSDGATRPTSSTSRR